METPKFEGQIFLRGEDGYTEHCYQYASSSHAEDGSINPAFILYPKNMDDIVKAIEYARENKIAIAVRTGGHQYSGASSTSGDNIQLDMSETCLEFEWDATNGLLRTGISHSLKEFNKKLRDLGLFIPHGQCSHVHVGGHVQTGGYGQLGRSFGLFGDHVESLEIITADGQKRTATKTNKYSDLFYAVLGGSPGNFGVLTHINIKPYQDKDYENSRGLKAMYLYNRERLRKILDVLVEMANNNDFPQNYDFCVSMLSSNLSIPFLFRGIDKHMETNFPELFGGLDDQKWPPVIIVYAQWANLKKEKYDPSWFNKIKVAAGIPILGYYELNDDKPMKLSELTKYWIFKNVREFELPYEKRTYVTNSKTLIQDKWTEWVTNRIHEIESEYNGCKLCVQIQHFGGSNSQFYSKGINSPASYSWRKDSTIVCVLDCFYDQHKFLAANPKQTAIDWQHTNDHEGVGNHNAKFCKEDRRVLWGSYGTKRLDDVWQYYYEDEAKYKKLCDIKKKYDPEDTFTPNAFCVGSKKQFKSGTRVAAVDDKDMVSRLKDRREAFLNQQ